MSSEPTPLIMATPLNTPFGTMLMPSHCQFVTPMVAQTGFWSPEECMMLQVLLREGDTFVDVGAHAGFLTMTGAHAVGKTGKVISVEPTPQTAAILRENVKNHGQEQVTVIEAGAWSEDGEGQISISATNSGDNRTVEAKDADHVEHIDIKRVALDTILADEDRVDVIKMDIQGAEPHAIRGALDTLRKHRPVVMMEFWPPGLIECGEDPEDLLDLVRSLGYAVRIAGLVQIDDATNEEVMQFVSGVPGNDITLILLPIPEKA